MKAYWAVARKRDLENQDIREDNDNDIVQPSCE